MDTSQQREARRKFLDYRLGWLDGANYSSIDQTMNSPEYSLGYSDGRLAIQAALAEAEKKFEYNQARLHLGENK